MVIGVLVATVDVATVFLVIVLVASYCPCFGAFVVVELAVVGGKGDSRNMSNIATAAVIVVIGVLVVAVDVAAVFLVIVLVASYCPCFGALSSMLPVQLD